MNPFQEHAANISDYEDMLRGDDNSGGATITFPNLNPPLTIDCRFDRIIDNFEMMGGQSPKLMVPECKFLAGKIPDAQKQFIRKDLFCILKPNPKAAGISTKIWTGGLEQGGFSYLFMLVDRNYGA